jgi:hypothetical protein
MTVVSDLELVVMDVWWRLRLLAIAGGVTMLVTMVLIYLRSRDES